MGQLVVRPGTGEGEDVYKSYLLANEAKTLPFLGGFTSQGQIRGWFEGGNSKSPHNLVAVLDGEVVGFSASTSKHTHYLEFGLVTVAEDLRRQKIGSSLYFFHVLRGALSGRFFVKDQYIHFNDVMIDHFGPYHGLTEAVSFRYKIRNFSTIKWFLAQITPEMIREWQSRTEGQHDLQIVLEDQANFVDNFNSVVKQLEEMGRGEDAERVRQNREVALELIR